MDHPLVIKGKSNMQLAVAVHFDYRSCFNNVSFFDVEGRCFFTGKFNVVVFVDYIIKMISQPLFTLKYKSVAVKPVPVPSVFFIRNSYKV